MKYPETTIIYNKIKDNSKLSEAQLTLVGLTKDKINTAMHQCISAGMSRKVAMRTIYKMWNYAEPVDMDNVKEENDSAK